MSLISLLVNEWLPTALFGVVCDVALDVVDVVSNFLSNT